MAREVTIVIRAENQYSSTLADLPPMDDYLARIWIERLGRNLATFADDLHAVSLLLSMEADHKQAKQRKASKRIVSGKRPQ